MSLVSDDHSLNKIENHKIDFRIQLDALIQKKSWNGFLIAENENTISITNSIGFLWEKVKGKLGILGGDRTESNRVKTAAIVFLKNNESYIDRSDFLNIGLLTEKIGLTKNDGKDDLRELVSTIKTRVLNKIIEESKTAKQTIRLVSAEASETRAVSPKVEVSTEESLTSEDFGFSTLFEVTSEGLIEVPDRSESSSTETVFADDFSSTDTVVDNISANDPQVKTPDEPSSDSSDTIQEQPTRTVRALKQDNFTSGKWSTALKIVSLIGLIGVSYFSLQTAGNILPANFSINLAPPNLMPFGVPLEIVPDGHPAKEYISLVKDLNPKSEMDARSILAQNTTFDEEKFKADKDNYLKKLFRKIAGSVHPDKCPEPLKGECSIALKKAEDARDYLNGPVAKPESREPDPFKGDDVAQHLFNRMASTNSHEDLLRAAGEYVKEAQAEAKAKIDRMTREELDDYILYLDIDELDDYTRDYLFVFPTTKENHRLLTKQQIEYLVKKYNHSPDTLYEMFEEAQWVKYIEDWDFSAYRESQNVFNIIAEKGYLHHLDNVQLKAAIIKFGLNYRNRQNSLVSVIDDLSQEQIKGVVQSLSYHELNRLFDEPDTREIIMSNVKWLSVANIKELIAKTSLSSMCTKMSEYQLKRYMQGLDARTRKIQQREVETSQRMSNEKLPEHILKIIGYDA